MGSKHTQSGKMGGKMNDVTDLNKTKGTCLKQAPF